MNGRVADTGGVRVGANTAGSVGPGGVERKASVCGRDGCAGGSTPPLPIKLGADVDIAWSTFLGEVVNITGRKRDEMDMYRDAGGTRCAGCNGGRVHRGGDDGGKESCECQREVHVRAEEDLSLRNCKQNARNLYHSAGRRGRKFNRTRAHLNPS